MKFISWNVNGIRAVHRKEIFPNYMLEEDADIFCMQETKAHSDQLSAKITEIPGYFSYFSKPQKKGYSGVSVYSKVEPLKVETDLGVERFDAEGRILKVTFEDFILYNVYFPNGAASVERLAYKLAFHKFFLEETQKMLQEGKSVIVCGDVNIAHREIDLFAPEKNQTSSGFLAEEREWIDAFVKIGFRDSFRELCQDAERYSWWDYRTRARERNDGWRIDYFFISNDLSDRLEKADICDQVVGSDHCPTLLTLK